MDTMYILIFLTVCAGLAGWMLFLWAVKSGQYDDVEGPKYRMLEDDDDLKKTESRPDEIPPEASVKNRKANNNGKDHEP